MDNEQKEVVFTDGLIFKKPREGAPDFVKGAMSFKVDEFKAFLDKHNNNGWVNVDLKVSKGGKLYTQLNDWKPAVDEHAPVNPMPAPTDAELEDPSQIAF